MADYNYIDGASRKRLISNITSEATQGGSVDFGAFQVTRYSRFVGYLIANSVGNTGLRLRHRFSTASGGPFVVTSSTLVTSGASAFSGTVIDLLNYGQYAYFDIISADSTTTYTLLLNAEPLR